MQYVLQLVEIIPIALNNTFFVIGSVQDVFVHAEFILPDGFIELDKAGSITSLGIDGYYEATALGRYDYAKPGKSAEKVTS